MNTTTVHVSCACIEWFILCCFQVLFIYQCACSITPVNLPGPLMGACSKECTVHLPTIEFRLLVGPTTRHWVSWRQELARPCMGAHSITRNKPQTAIQHNKNVGKQSSRIYSTCSLWHTHLIRTCTLQRDLLVYVYTSLDGRCSVLAQIARTVFSYIFYIMFRY